MADLVLVGAVLCFILTFVVAIAVGTLLIFLFSRWIGRVGFTLANAFWGSAVGHILPALVALGLRELPRDGEACGLLGTGLCVQDTILVYS